MKKTVLFTILSVCILAIFLCAFVPAAAENNLPASAGADYNATETRFLNMLNRNYVYNSDFISADVVAENSIIALLNMRDSENSDYIPEAVVKGFVSDMYGIEIIDFVQDADTKKDGYVYIIPRGFTDYTHKIDSITQNEDGSFTVVSYVTVNPHDDNEFITTAETLFVPNDNSAFGYNIIYSTLHGVSDGI